MKKEIIFAVLTQLFVSFCYSQNVNLDTLLYYDKDWKGVSSAAFATFYKDRVYRLY